MSFTLRQVTRRAGGGDIVRARPIAAAEPVVGRGADCDIQIADLAVSLRHARLRQSGPGRVEIQSLGALAVEIDGRFPRQADLTLARSPKIVLGSHELRLTAGEAPGEVVVTVARAERRRGGSAAGDEAAVFSPPAAVFGKRRLAWALGLGILLACLAAPMAAFFLHQRHGVIHPDQQWSSGPLSSVHGFLRGDCQACHRQAFVAVRDEACAACHGANRDRASILRTAREVRLAGGPFAPALIRDHAAHDRLFAATPLPAKLGPRIEAMFARAFHHSNDRCASCHLEHLTADGRRRAVATVGGPPRKKPFLVNVESCVDCHAGLKARLGATTLLDTPDWGRHPDFRPLIVVADRGGRPLLRRIALARRPLDHTGLAFSHRLHLGPAGFVARMALELGRRRGYGEPLACANCHHPDGVGRSFAPVEMTRDCSACHSLAFAGPRSALRNLPHGSVKAVVAELEAFYAGRRTGPAPGLAGRRRPPGIAAEIRWAWRPVGPPGPPSAQAARAVRAAFAPSGVCAYGHAIGRGGGPATLGFTVTPVHLTARYLPRGAFDHALRAHHLDAAGRPACATCHGARASDRAGDILIPRIAACAACHGRAKPQAARDTQTGVAASAACGECHSYHVPSAPVSRAARPNWGLEGRQAGVQPVSFQGTPLS